MKDLASVAPEAASRGERGAPFGFGVRNGEAPSALASARLRRAALGSAEATDPITGARDDVLTRYDE